MAQSHDACSRDELCLFYWEFKFTVGLGSYLRSVHQGWPYKEHYLPGDITLRFRLVHKPLYKVLVPKEVVYIITLSNQSRLKYLIFSSLIQDFLTTLSAILCSQHLLVHLRVKHRPEKASYTKKMV